MAKNVLIRGVQYTAVPQVSIPEANGGTATFYETSDSNVTAADVTAGIYFYNANGRGIGAKVDVVVAQDSGTKILSIS